MVTEKLDGESFTLYSDGHTHARSIDSPTHPARTRARALAPVLSQELPRGWRLSAENLQARHSTAYERLPSPIAVIAVWDSENEALGWDETREWAELLGLPTVPELYRGQWDEAGVRALSLRREGQWTKPGVPPEGYVVRLSGRIPHSAYSRSVAKFVRAGFILPDAERWDRGEIEENEWA